MSKQVTKKELDIAREFGKAFEYRYDPRITTRSWGRFVNGLVDTWSILSMSADGKYYGDCEDFSLTTLYLLKDKSLWKFVKAFVTGEAKMHFVITRTGGGHAVMQYKDKYIDNWSRKFTTKAQMERYGHNFKHTVWFPFVFFNLVKGKITNTIRKLIGL